MIPSALAVGMNMDMGVPFLGVESEDESPSVIVIDRTRHRFPQPR
ncbi:hypothetical protein BQ8420_14955 [Nocardiopsis sp. JB363]|nr:hypothetical protein BQ8420_14955 [Nocardiopsis sp. JB363]